MSKRGRLSRIPRARRHYHAASLVKSGSPAQRDSCKESVIVYDSNRVHEEQTFDTAQLRNLLHSWRVVWVDVEGTAIHDMVEKLAHQFNIHQLVVEDILTSHQRAKLEQYDDNFFLITHLMGDKEGVDPKQLSMFIGKNFVLSFQDEPTDGLKAVRDRIRNNQGMIRSHGADYLVYAIVDAVIDSYFPLLEKLGERLEDLEDQVMENPTRESISEIHIIKRELLIMRRAIWPLREAINSLLRDATDVLGEEARLHLRDSYNHAVQVLDFIETYREVGADLMDVYLSSVSNRMNEVMKVLTIITTIFMPPTLIAAIYGMNFDTNISPYNMPETKWYYGYPIILAVMLLATLGLVCFLWWKGWFGALTLAPGKSAKEFKGEHDRE